jgi:transposase
MEIQLGKEERAALEQAQRTTRSVAQWQRYQVLLLMGQQLTPEAVAQAVGVCRASVYTWTKAYRERGLAGLTIQQRQVWPRRLDGAGEAWLDALVRTDPQAHGYVSTGWTVPLLLEEARTAGYTIGEKALRQSLHRLGWRWKRPKYVLGRPDPAYEEKKGRWSRG